MKMERLDSIKDLPTDLKNALDLLKLQPLKQKSLSPKREKEKNQTNLPFSQNLVYHFT